MIGAPQHTYRRLPGRRRRVGTLWTAARHSLWLGADHLLKIENRLYTEEYRRFYYRDIQAIMIRRTMHWIVWNIIFGVLCGGSVGLSIQVREPGGQIIGASLAGLSLLAILVNSLWGPTYACHLRTAVQTVALPSLSRRRYVCKALDLLQPLIVQAQGACTPDVVLAAGGMTPLAGAELRATPGRGPLPTSPRLLQFRGGRHAFLFSFLLCDGMVTLLTLLGDSFVALLLTWATLTGAIVTAIMALAIQHQSHCPQGLRVLTWGAGIYVSLLYAVRSILAFLLILRSPDIFMVDSFWEIIELQAAQSLHDQPYLYMTSLIALVCSLGLSVVGGLYLVGIRRRRSVPPPLHLTPIPAVEE